MIGTTTTVTIQGNGFKSGATVNAGTGITVSVNSVSTTQIQASFNVSTSAPAGDHNVTVTISGKQSNAVNFFVQVPTSLGLTIGPKVTYNGNDLIECDGTNNGPRWGYSRCLTYQLKDQGNPPQSIQGAGLFAEEAFVTVSSNPPNVPGRIANNFLASNGTFQDFLAFVAVSPPPPQPGEFVKQRQTFTIVNTLTGSRYQVRVNDLPPEN